MHHPYSRRKTKGDTHRNPLLTKQWSFVQWDESSTHQVERVYITLFQLASWHVTSCKSTLDHCMLWESLCLCTLIDDPLLYTVTGRSLTVQLMRLSKCLFCSFLLDMYTRQVAGGNFFLGNILGTELHLISFIPNCYTTKAMGTVSVHSDDVTFQLQLLLWDNCNWSSSTSTNSPQHWHKNYTTVKMWKMVINHYRPLQIHLWQNMLPIPTALHQHRGHLPTINCEKQWCHSSMPACCNSMKIMPKEHEIIPKRHAIGNTVKTSFSLNRTTKVPFSNTVPRD